MATFLYRLGRACHRRRRAVVGLWALLVVLAGLGAATLSGTLTSSFSIPGTESQQALDLLEERLPEASADGATARVVLLAPQGTSLTAGAPKAAVEGVVRELQALPGVASVVDPYAAGAVSRDGRTAYASITYGVPSPDLSAAERAALLDAGAAAERAGLTVEVGGDAAQEVPEQGAAEAIGLGVAAVVLLGTFGSLVAAGLPLLTAVVGVGLTVAGISVLSGVVELGSSTPALATMIGLAVAIDYALFIVSRYRHELLAGHDGAEAAGRAVGTAGSAVVFAGATVVIALGALTVVGIPFLSEMGLAAAATVLVAVLIALTLVPALLGTAGLRVLGRRGRAARDVEGDAGPTPWGERWARFVLRRRVPVVLAVVLGLGVLAVPALDLELALPSEGSASPETTQRRAYDALAAGFGPGVNGPLLVALDLAGAPDGAAVTQRVAAGLAEVDGVLAVAPAGGDRTGDTALLAVVPATGPSDPATERLVQDLRRQARDLTGTRDAALYVTGATAVGIDVSEKVSSALVPYLLVVVGLAFLLLLLVFRSVLVPVKATAGFLLSVAAAFGAVVAVFQWGWLGGLLGVDAPGPVLSFLPIFLVGVLFGLAMDYEVFLVTRMREEHVHGASADDAVVQGFRHGARVVTAAGLIMLSVFAGFVTASEVVIKSIGFGLAAGILFDAFAVRMTLVPAVMSLLGERAWWLPRWLDRALPKVDVEGEELSRLLAERAEAPVLAGTRS